MMNTLNKISAFVLVGIGIVHIVFGIIDFNALSARLMWFLGSGLAIIYLGLMNMVWSRSRTEFMYKVLLSCNVSLLLFMGVMIYVLPMLPAFIGLGALLVVLFANDRLRKMT